MSITTEDKQKRLQIIAEIVLKSCGGYEIRAREIFAKYEAADRASSFVQFLTTSMGREMKSLSASLDTLEQVYNDSLNKKTGKPEPISIGIGLFLGLR